MSLPIHVEAYSGLPFVNFAVFVGDPLMNSISNVPSSVQVNWHDAPSGIYWGLGPTRLGWRRSQTEMVPARTVTWRVESVTLERDQECDDIRGRAQWCGLTLFIVGPLHIAWMLTSGTSSGTGKVLLNELEPPHNDRHEH
jgi:hypothetical protein